jgi:magnesium transporter
VIVVHFIDQTRKAAEGAEAATVACKTLETTEAIPPGAIWIDMIKPTPEEDRMVQTFVGVAAPTRSDPDYTEPPEAHYSENGVRYLHAGVPSEPDETPDITGVTFVVAPTTLVTIRYHPAESFDLFAQKLCKSRGQALFPDAIAIGLITTVVNRSARALANAGESLDRIASAVFRARGDQSRRNKVYSDTLDALAREEEKISNVRESMESMERLLAR